MIDVAFAFIGTLLGYVMGGEIGAILGAVLSIVVLVQDVLPLCVIGIHSWRIVRHYTYDNEVECRRCGLRGLR